MPRRNTAKPVPLGFCLVLNSTLSRLSAALSRGGGQRVGLAVLYPQRAHEGSRNWRTISSNSGDSGVEIALAHSSIIRLSSGSDIAKLHR